MAMLVTLFFYLSICLPIHPYTRNPKRTHHSHGQYVKAHSKYNTVGCVRETKKQKAGLQQTIEVFYPVKGRSNKNTQNICAVLQIRTSPNEFRELQQKSNQPENKDEELSVPHRAEGRWEGDACNLPRNAKLQKRESCHPEHWSLSQQAHIIACRKTHEKQKKKNPDYVYLQLAE